MTKKTDKPAETEPVVKAIHVALGFATFALMAVFLVKPVADFAAGKSGQNRIVKSASSDDVDSITTGSISTPKPSVSKTKRQDRLYTVRRSVLQKSHENTCVIAKDGSRTGDC